MQRHVQKSTFYSAFLSFLKIKLRKSMRLKGAVTGGRSGTIEKRKSIRPQGGGHLAVKKHEKSCVKHEFLFRNVEHPV